MRDLDLFVWRKLNHDNEKVGLEPGAPVMTSVVPTLPHHCHLVRILEMRKMLWPITQRDNGDVFTNENSIFCHA